MEVVRTHTHSHTHPETELCVDSKLSGKQLKRSGWRSCSSWAAARISAICHKIFSVSSPWTRETTHCSLWHGLSVNKFIESNLHGASFCELRAACCLCLLLRWLCHLSPGKKDFILLLLCWRLQFKKILWTHQMHKHKHTCAVVCLSHTHTGTHWKATISCPIAFQVTWNNT